MSYHSKSHTIELLKRMKKPWMIDPENDGNANLLLKSMFEDDAFLDDLTDEIAKRKKSFDGRNFIKKFLKETIKDEELGGHINSDLETWNMTRKAVGLKPLNSKQILDIKFNSYAQKQQKSFAISLKEALKIEAKFQRMPSGVRTINEISKDIKNQVLKMTGLPSRDIFFFTEMASYHGGFWTQNYLFMDLISASHSKDLFFAELSFMTSEVPKIDQSFLKNVFQAVPEIVRAATSPTFKRRMAFLIDPEVDASKKSFWIVSAKEKMHIKKVQKRCEAISVRQSPVKNRGVQIQREKDFLQNFLAKYPDTEIIIPKFVKRTDISKQKLKTIRFKKSDKDKQTKVTLKHNMKALKVKSLKKDRPFPAESATLFKPGTKKSGQDGKMYIIKESSNGVRRWVKFNP